MSEKEEEGDSKQTEEDKIQKKNAKLLYELMFEDMQPYQFLKAAKKAVVKAKKDAGKCRVLLIALLNWVDDNPIRFSPDSCMGRLTELILRFDEDDDVESDDILTFIAIIRDFLNNISAKDIMSVESWEASANMSPNLLALFGKPPSSSKLTIEPDAPNWNAPSKFGLNNSSPIFVTVSAKAAANSSSSVNSPTNKSIDVKDRQNGAKEEDGGIDVAEPKQSPLMSSAKDSNDDKGREEKEEEVKGEEEGPPVEEGEEEEEEDDDDDDNDYEEGEEEEPRQITMSLNLMRALGLDTTGMEMETDWKPPEVAGIEANPDSYKL